MGKDYKIPFNANGEMLSCAPRSYVKNIDWRDNIIWSDSFSLIGGYGASQYEIKSIISGKSYYLFASDFKKFIKLGTIQNGIISGSFKFCKKGTSYGVVCVSGSCSSHIENFYEFLVSGRFTIERHDDWCGYYGVDNGYGIFDVIQRGRLIDGRIVESFELVFNRYGFYDPVRWHIDESRDWVEFIRGYVPEENSGEK